jgi:hypothetical protein
VRTLRIALISLAIVLAASCGGSSSPKATDPATTAPATSTSAPKARAAYLAAGNALCKTMNARVARLANQGASAKNEAAVTDQATKILAETLAKLRKLPMPRGDETKLRAIYAKIDVILADAPKLSAALRADDQAAGQRIQVKLQQDSKVANDLSNAYGLTICGS